MSEGNQVFPDQLIFFVQNKWKKRDFETFRVFFLYFAAPENIDAHHKGGLWKFRGRQGLNSHFLKESMKLNGNSSGGDGVGGSLSEWPIVHKCKCNIQFYRVPAFWVGAVSEEKHLC